MSGSQFEATAPQGQPSPRHVTNGRVGVPETQHLDVRLSSDAHTPPPPAHMPMPRDLHSEVFTAVYSGVNVFEMTCRGVSVMRRISDSALNATQILKVAGIEKGRRTKILEREILTGPHEKVQGGYGKYQGTWISYDIGIALCERHAVRDYLAPLLELDPANVATMNATPTKEQHQASIRRHMTNGNGISGGSTRTMVYDTTRLQDRGTSAAILASLQSHRHVDSGAILRNSDGPLPIPQTMLTDTYKLPHVLRPLSPRTTRNFEHSREIMTSMFLENDVMKVPDVLSNDLLMQDVDIDVPIDELGHTALHWAASLARLPLLKALISRGADPCRGNTAGETPLIRAVLVTNSMDENTFIDLLDVLGASLTLIDSSKRSVLHHICLTSGINGRALASRFYLDSLLEWIVTRTDPNALTLEQFTNQIVDIQDRNGDSALNIAARLGNRNLVQSLLEVGADAYLSNKARIRPVDSGTVDTRLYQPKSGSKYQRPATSGHQQVAQASGDVITAITTMISQLQKDFAEEMAAKTLLVESTNAQLREANQALADLRRNVESGKLAIGKLDDLTARISNTQQAIQEAKTAYDKSQVGNPPPQFGHKHDASTKEHNIISSDPTTYKHLSTAQLSARIQTHQEGLKVLDETKISLSENIALKEARCRKIVAQCAGVPVDQVDTLLTQLLATVQSDVNEPHAEIETARIAGFLKIIPPSQHL